MKTMQPALKNGRNVWDTVAMPREEFDTRIERVRAAMRERGIELLLVHTRGFDDYGDATYLTNFIIRLARGTILALPLTGEPVTFFEGASRGIPSLKLTTSAGDLKAANDLAKDCAKYLKEKKLVPSNVGLAGVKRMPYQQYQTLMADLDGCTLKDASDLIAGLRRIKSARESDQVRRSSRILGKLVAYLRESRFDKLNERTVEALLYKEARLEGAEDFRVLIGKPSQASWAFQPINDLPINAGERVILYMAVEFERYWAEATRTFTFNGSLLIEERNADISSRYHALCKGLKPGKKVSDFVREASVAMGAEGTKLLEPYGLGSGVGLGLYEAPLLVNESADTLAEGMLVSLRMATMDGGDPTMLGNTVCVTATGGVILTTEPAKPEER
jgi:Xaa-Pro aminopeptidase